MLTVIENLKRRYANLSGTGFSEKLMYAVFVRLKQVLFSNGVIDLNGLRTRPVKKHLPHREELSSSSRIVCLTGLGHSGSGAVADLLSEYDEVQVMSHVDTNGSLRNASTEEFDLLCGAGGLFSLEEAFVTRNERVRDLAVKLFLRFVDSIKKRKITLNFQKLCAIIYINNNTLAISTTEQAEIR